MDEVAVVEEAEVSALQPIPDGDKQGKEGELKLALFFSSVRVPRVVQSIIAGTPTARYCRIVGIRRVKNGLVRRERSRCRAQQERNRDWEIFLHDFQVLLFGFSITDTSIE